MRLRLKKAGNGRYQKFLPAYRIPALLFRIFVRDAEIGLTPYKPVQITVSLPVSDSDGTQLEGLKIYAFNATTITGYNAKTETNGQVNHVRPDDDYPFRGGRAKYDGV
ncbi:MAG: hypothetical protein LWX83_14670 [Anaerolineae bacterium]|nr:hypothetical protein [Anaerolineae bacterium]